MKGEKKTIYLIKLPSRCLLFASIYSVHTQSGELDIPILYNGDPKSYRVTANTPPELEKPLKVVASDARGLTSLERAMNTIQTREYLQLLFESLLFPRCRYSL